MDQCSTQQFHIVWRDIGAIRRDVVLLLDHSTAEQRIQIGQLRRRQFRFLVFENRVAQRKPWILFCLRVTRQEHPAFEQHQLACHVEKFRSHIHSRVEIVRDIRHILVAEQGDRNIIDIDFVLDDQRQQKIERTLKLIELVIDRGFHRSKPGDQSHQREHPGREPTDQRRENAV